MKAATLCPDKLQFVVHQRSWWIVHILPTKKLSHARPKSHQRSWWIVHTLPTKKLSHARPKSHQRSWWIVHTLPTKKLSHACSSQIPPTKLVDRSYSAYKEAASSAVSVVPSTQFGGIANGVRQTFCR